MTNREDLTHAFLLRAGWGTADRRFLAADSSTRRYDRLVRGAETAVLMDAPPPDAEDPALFLAIADYLAGCGLSAPRCLAKDLPNGFLLLEDLGDGIFARLVEADPTLERLLYQLATQVLLHLQRQVPPPELANLSAGDWADAATFALDWYRFGITGERCEAGAFKDTLTTAPVSYTHLDVYKRQDLDHKAKSRGCRPRLADTTPVRVAFSTERSGKLSLIHI